MDLFRSTSMPTLVVFAAFLAVITAVASATPPGCNSYARASRSTYNFDDGGCYLCSETSGPQAQLPLSGMALSDHCKRLCEADEECVAYTVGRAPSLPVQDYYYGVRANCCLERREYPSGAFVEVTRDTVPRNNCERDAMCWDRYEKKGKDSSDEKCSGSISPKTPSGMCEAVWEAEEYSDKEIQEKIDFIAGGCQINDTEYESMLAVAADQCAAEAFAESMSVKIISHPSALYLRATILDK